MSRKSGNRFSDKDTRHSIRLERGRSSRVTAYSEAAASPPEAAAVVRLDLAGVGNGRALERAVERGQHAPLDEIESRRLAVARTRQVAGDLLVDAARPRTHHHDAVGEHHRLLDIVGDHDERRLELGPEIEEMHL